MATNNDGKHVVAKVDVSAHMDSAVSHGITGVPTIVIFKNGSEVGRHMGFAPLEKLQAMLDEA